MSDQAPPEVVERLARALCDSTPVLIPWKHRSGDDRERWRMWATDSLAHIAADPEALAWLARQGALGGVHGMAGVVGRVGKDHG